jgi:hypothetical protein
MDEEMKAAMAQLGEALSGISAGLAALAAKVDALKPAEPAEPAEPPVEDMAAKAAADTASLAEFTAALSAATTAGRVTVGEAEDLAALAATMPIEGRAKLAASFGKRGTPAVPPENLKNQPAPLTGEAKAAEIQKHIRAKLSAEPGDYTRAVLAVRREHPELFAGAAEEVK